MERYAKRKYNFEPLTNILGDYSNDIFARSIKEVLFEKKTVYVYIKDVSKGSIATVADCYIPKKIWRLRKLNCPKNMDYTHFAAKEVIEYQKTLRNFVWRKNGWNRKPETTREKFNFLSGIAFRHENEFINTYWDKFAYFISDEEKRRELMHAIYTALNNRYQDGVRDGARLYKEKMSGDNKVKMIDIYNSLEIGLNDLKKLIDE